MAEQLSHWERVAMPLLERLVEREDELREKGFLEVGGDRGREALGLDIDEGELFDGLFQLQDLGYITFEVNREGGSGALFLKLQVTGRGLQVLGDWPRFEAWVSPETLASFAERLIEFAPANERTRLERAAAYLRQRAPGVIKGAAIAAGSQLARNAVGLP